MWFRFSASVLVTMVVGSLLLASCSNASPVATPEMSSTSKPYGSLVIGSGAITQSAIDPALATPATFQEMAAAIFDSLTEMSPQGQIIPGIAERWEIATNGMSQTFYIRKGVKFHNGDDLTGADVKFSIERMMSPIATHSDAAVWRSFIASVALKDDFTVVINMKAPVFELLKGFTDFGGSPAVVPKKYLEEKGNDYFGTHPVGSGPYKYVGGVAGASIELEAMDSHWKGVPKFKNITVLKVPNEASKVAMLKTGELDAAMISPDSAADLQKAGLRILKHEGGSQYFAIFYYDIEHPKDAAMGDVKVRKAMSLAVNRKEIIDYVYKGYGEPSVLFYGGRSADFWDSNLLKPDPYDPEGAKKLLTEAGYPNGFTTKLWDKDPGGINTTLNTSLVGYWSKIGVKTEIVPIEFAAFTPKYRPKMTPEIFNSLTGSISSAGPFGFEKMVQVHHSKKGVYQNHANARLDELIDKVPTMLDGPEKKKAQLEATVLARDDYHSIAVLDIYTIYALGPKVGDVTIVKNLQSFADKFYAVSHPK
ncbi:MAG: ABC transporter substrate-binding protein [Dehalococcoidia bacterium]|nr:ABC transporter substrate-binding protein [Dehalococcoidia bacterium]